MAALDTSLLPDQNAMRAEKRGVALNSVLVAVAITALKLFVGLGTSSLGILSEAAHSGLDLVAAVITLLSVRVSDEPADAQHQYGHGKVENFSAFLQIGLLLATSAWIVWEAFNRLFYHNVHIQPSLLAFGVLFCSMGLDFWRARKLSAIANKYDSQALHADALHFSTDILSSGVVAFGLAMVWWGDRHHIAWLRNSDPVAALVVAGVVLYVSSRLGRQTIDALLDAAPPGFRNRIMDVVSRVEGVIGVDQVRIRRAGTRYFADVSIALGRSATFQRSEEVVNNVSKAINRILPNADVMVRSIPRDSGRENIFDRVRAVAARNNMTVHDVSVQNIEGRLHVEQHLELDERLSLKDAHSMVSHIESEMRNDLPEVSSILTHIESEPSTIEATDAVLPASELELRLRSIAAEFPDIVDLHDLEVKQIKDRLYVSCHCTMADDLPLGRVHDITTALEIRYKQEAPNLFKVLIHPEPQTDNTR